MQILWGAFTDGQCRPLFQVVLVKFPNDSLLIQMACSKKQLPLVRRLWGIWHDGMSQACHHVRLWWRRLVKKDV